MGYTGYTVEEIESAMLATLQADETLSGYVRTFDRMPWDRLNDLEKLLTNYPALIVAYAGGEDQTGNFNVCDHAGRFVVLCANKNVRSPSAASRGEVTGEKGVYDMLLDVLNALHFSSLGLTIIGCVSKGIVAVSVTPSLAIFSREFVVRWRMSRS